MTIRFECPVCGERLSAPEEKAGVQSVCRRCNNPITIPALGSFSGVRPFSPWKNPKLLISAAVVLFFLVSSFFWLPLLFSRSDAESAANSHAAPVGNAELKKDVHQKNDKKNDKTPKAEAKPLAKEPSKLVKLQESGTEPKPKPKEEAKVEKQPGPSSDPKAAVTIVEDGKSPLPILVGSHREPADEIQHYLKQITGADFPIQKSGGDARGIYVGLAADFPMLKIEVPDDLGGEGFVMKTDGSNVYLLAKASHGVSHAANTFLQKVGCRWFFPGATWEVIPRQKTISVSFDERQSPTFSIGRHIWYGFGADGPCKADQHKWDHHNRMGGSMSIEIGHSSGGLNREKDFPEHPDWFALVNGKRTAHHPCYSHPEVIKRAIQHALGKAAAGAHMISMTPADGLGYCECEQCLAVCQGGKPYKKHMATYAKRPDGVVVNVTSETLFNCVNQVAAAVAEKYPKTLIGCYAYSAYAHPPSFKLHPNVFIQVTTAYRRTDLSLGEQLEMFKDRGCQAGIRDYFSVYQWDWDAAPPNGKLSPSHMQKHLNGYHQHGVTSINAESSNNWGPRGLSYYLAAQLMWDVKADTKALVVDFYEKAFGPAAKPMEHYYLHWYGAGGIEASEEADNETGDKKHESSKGGNLKELYKDLDEAANLAKDRPDCLARIDHLRMYLHFLVLRQKTSQASKSKNNQAIIDAVHEESVFTGRLVYTNMVHTRAALGKAFFRHFKKEEKALQGVPELQTQHKGWRANGQPPTHAEVEQFWAADKTYLQVK